MKLKSLFAFISAAAALPLGAPFAQNNAEPGGPQGTAWYGNPGPLAVYDLNRDGIISAEERAAASMRVDPVDRRAERRVITRDERRARYPYNGFSADTNPPAPAP